MSPPDPGKRSGAVDEVLDDIEPQECAKFLRHAGFVSNQPGHAQIHLLHLLHLEAH